MNNVTLTSRLTQDPTVRTAGELQICDLRLAVPRRRGLVAGGHVDEAGLAGDALAGEHSLVAAADVASQRAARGPPRA